jgi:glutamate-1-semialdehyde 2,1-aminomutase
MESEALAAYFAAPVALSYLFVKARQRLQLSRAKHGSLAGHARMARRVASLVPFYEYDDQQFFRSDDPPEDVAQRRADAFGRLSDLYRIRFARSRAATSEFRGGVSDVQFTDAYRVPFQYSRIVRENLSAGSVLSESEGVTLRDLDGNVLYDLAGSYGVNLLGFDFYKGTIERGSARVRDLGPVLGAYHPIFAYNVARLKEISGLDEVSFHMSGTEAVMQAVRLARYHTGKTHVVRFCGAYHGWWGDVQPGIGNPITERETYTLADMSERTLNVLRRRRDIACVLVNPLQALHPNGSAPADTSLVDGARKAHVDRQAYTEWLKQLRAVCTERKIALIFDEVFVGFRLAQRGAREYFGVQPDMITYGKTLGGGLPVGVVCGRHDLMRRYRDDRPADICFARGTFNSHPYVMAAMHEFLRYLETPEAAQLYENLDETWNARAADLNAMLERQNLPVRVANLSSIWTVCYTRPSRYNWMFQYYLRAEGLALSWVGTGRLIFSLNYTDADFAAVAERFVAAATAMERDGWWWVSGTGSNKAIRRQILREMIGAYRAKWFGKAAAAHAPLRPAAEVPLLSRDFVLPPSAPYPSAPHGEAVLVRDSTA